MKTIYDRRLHNLRLLIAERGAESIAKACNLKGVSYLSQLAGKNPTRPITERTARKLEDGMGLASNWLDVERDLYGAAVPNPSPLAEVGLEDRDTELVASAAFGEAAKAVTEAMVATGKSIPPEKFQRVVELTMRSVPDGHDAAVKAAKDLLELIA